MDTDMLEQIYKKVMFVCRLVAVVVAVLLLIFIVVLFGSSHEYLNWRTGMAYPVIQIPIIALFACLFFSVFVLVYLRWKEKK
jgi:membrane protein YdbS with pleckstrin-like domain